LDGRDLPLGHPPSPRLLGRPRMLRPRPLRARAGGGPAAPRLDAVRRRAALLRGRQLRRQRGPDRPRPRRPALPPPPGRRPPGRTDARHHPAGASRRAGLRREADVTGDAPTPPAGRSEGAALGAAVLASAMAFVDATALNVALPAL